MAFCAACSNCNVARRSQAERHEAIVAAVAVRRHCPRAAPAARRPSHHCVRACAAGVAARGGAARAGGRARNAAAAGCRQRGAAAVPPQSGRMTRHRARALHHGRSQATWARALCGRAPAAVERRRRLCPSRSGPQRRTGCASIHDAVWRRSQPMCARVLCDLAGVGARPGGWGWSADIGGCRLGRLLRATAARALAPQRARGQRVSAITTDVLSGLWTPV